MVTEAVHLLQKALQAFPIGGDEHDAVLSTVSKLSKIAPASGAIPGVQATMLNGLGQDAMKSAMLRQLMARAQAGGGGGEEPPPGAPPGGPPPDGGGAPPMMPGQ